MEGRGPKLSSVGLIIIAGNLCVCLCVCVVGRETVRERVRERERGRERVMRRYEIQLQGHYFLLTHVTRLKVGLEPQTFIMWAHCHI